MKLGKYFTLGELTQTSTGLVNSPNQDEITNLKLLVENVLDPAREELGDIISVTSGYRSPLVNRAVGGSKTSAHMKGRAADIKCSDNAKLFNILKKYKFRQLIWEKGNDKQPAWIHIEYNENDNKGQILKFDGKSYKTIN